MSKQTKKPTAAAADEAATPDHQMSCSGGWMVTGYYTPGEEEFGGPTTTITVPGVGPETFPAEFLRHVRIEGWGRTRDGWYLGFDRGDWVRGEAALNARGRPLRIGSLAVDRSVIPLGSHVRIPTLPAPWSEQEFIADDVGGGIHGAHVDVYCGAGPEARAETFRITADNMRVCIA